MPPEVRCAALLGVDAVRGTKAKRLRRAVYGDRALRERGDVQRDYAVEEWRGPGWFKGARAIVTKGRIVADKWRRAYQHAKASKPARSFKALRLRSDTREQIKAWRSRLRAKANGRRAA